MLSSPSLDSSTWQVYSYLITWSSPVCFTTGIQVGSVQYMSHQYCHVIQKQHSCNLLGWLCLVKYNSDCRSHQPDLLALVAEVVVIGSLLSFLHQWKLALYWGSLSIPHTSVVYGNTCIDRPTMSVPFTWYWYVARAHATRHAMLTCVVVNTSVRYLVVVTATRPRTLTMLKRKADTPAQRTVRLEWERDQLISSYLRSLVGGRHLWLSSTSVFLAGHFTPLFYIKHNMRTPHSGQDFPAQILSTALHIPHLAFNHHKMPWVHVLDNSNDGHYIGHYIGTQPNQLHQSDSQQTKFVTSKVMPS